jgi:hypothetical protein
MAFMSNGGTDMIWNWISHYMSSVILLHFPPLLHTGEGFVVGDDNFRLDRNQNLLYREANM